MSRNPSGALHPMILLVIWAALGLGLTRVWAPPFLPDAVALFGGVGLMVLGGILLGWAQIEFWRHGTSESHWKPTAALITTGPFRFSRHPIYLGLTVIMVGMGLWQESLWLVALAIPTAVLIHRLAVVKEEAYLAREFGEAYRRYQASVRQWL